MSRARCLASLLALFTICVDDSARGADAPPQVGAQAPEFELASPDGRKTKLSETLKSGPAVVVVLRGFPGYQCPLCTRQVGELLKSAEAFQRANATVLLIYPGSTPELTAKGKEFLGETKLPKNFRFLLDPGYKFTNAYGLRWDAPRETAYPSTFVVSREGAVLYALVSKTHGGRAPTADVLKALSTTR